MGKSLEPEDFERAAKALGVDVASIRAITEVESSGSGFIDGELPKILFERHVFRKQLQKRGIPTVLLERQYPDLISIRAGGYATGPDAKTRQLREHTRLDRAAKINRDAALESCSWGAFQCMGYHWKALGFKSLQDFVNAMYKGESQQLDAFVKFIKVDPSLHAAIKRKDWESVERMYNGPDFANKREYDKKLANAYQRHA